MNDLALQLLTQEIHTQRTIDDSEAALWILDENVNSTDIIPSAMANKDALSMICNRFDLQQQLTLKSFHCTFSDFDFGEYDDDSVGKIYYRVSKEKAVVHHIINEAYRILSPGGLLIIAGYKNEGAKTYIDKAHKLFRGSITKSKGGQSSHLAIISKGQVNETTSDTTLTLDDKDYRHTRSVSHQGTDFITKPGQFGWNKVDKGSAFLIEHLPSVLSQRHQPVESLLDLGCGYGYLSMMAALLNNTNNMQLQNIVATDNNAAAIKSCADNLKASNIPYKVIPDNCAQSIRGRFDLVLCNPPFHQGFSVESDLTQIFLEQTHKHLHAKGDAVFVVNQFIPLERKANDLFDYVAVLAKNKSFTLIHCKR